MPPDGLVTFDDVFNAELEVVASRRRSPLGVDPSLWGLALSGGGIRSAAFNLGLMQALGAKGILERCDYLSTVSGGGYIGSCLSSLCAADGDVTPAQFPLAMRRPPGSQPEEPAAVKYLRRHAQYLVPRHGLFRLDTWRLVSAYLGGLVLTLLTVGALLGIAAALGILLYPQAVNAVRSLLSRETVNGGDFWLYPELSTLPLFFPAIVAGTFWLVMVGWNALTGRWLVRRWTLAVRRERVRTQGAALMATGLLALFGALPFVFAELQAQLARVFVAGGVSALVLTRIFGLGREAKEAWDRFKSWVLLLGSWVFVAVACLAVLYAVWLYREWAAQIIGGCVVLLALLALFTDINRISMFYFYRDRLSEAFLVRAEPNDPDELAVKDTVPFADLAYGDRRVPYHLINTTVNLPGSADPTLHGRKADFFLLSPLFCGSPATGYRSTPTYERNRVNLGTAMAVSGAAVNPQHGNATSGSLAFLMTLLNARLGVWAENPRYERKTPLQQKGPPPRVFWPWYLASEMFSGMNERRKLVNLSDGGHIENLGVYELLRRRCRVIIASDAGADPHVTFGDLGNLVRKARIDLSTYVHLEQEQLIRLVPRETDRLVQARIAVGQITYENRTGAESNGTIYYVKPGLTLDDPVDLHEYRAAHPLFPHEPTTDQFFDEAQFESYRELGYQAGKEVVRQLGSR